MTPSKTRNNGQLLKWRSAAAALLRFAMECFWCCAAAGGKGVMRMDDVEKRVIVVRIADDEQEKGR